MVSIRRPITDTYDEVVQVLRNLRGETLALEDTQNLVTRHKADLRDAVAVTEGRTDLRGGNTLTGELHDLLHDLLGRRLQPRRRSAAVRQSRLANALSLRCVLVWSVGVVNHVQYMRPMVTIERGEVRLASAPSRADAKGHVIENSRE